MDPVTKSESVIRTGYQTTIPEDIRARAELQMGDTLLWKYDEIYQEIIVMPKPKSFTAKLWGLGKEIWEQDTADEYVHKERVEG